MARMKTKRSRATKRERATPAQIAKRKARAFALIKSHRIGWFARRDIADRLASDPNPSRTLSLLVADRLLKKRGDRRLTQYQVRG